MATFYAFYILTFYILTMETNVASALEARNYQQATCLLKQWQQQEPSSPLLWLYVAKLQEQTNKLASAQKTYLALLKQSASTKIIQQARAGVQRIENLQKTVKGQAIQAKVSANGAELAILAIASLPPSNPLSQSVTNQVANQATNRAAKYETSQATKAAIESIASVFNLDLYTARLKLPNSGLRIHRIGPWVEVDYYAQQLAAPCFCVKISQIKSLQTFQVKYFEALSPNLVVVCKNADGQLGRISFDTAEVSQVISAQLPIFEQVVDLGSWGRTVYKERVLDYAQVLDLQLPGRQIVLRICDRLYQYQKGITLGTTTELSSRIQWNELRSQLIKTSSDRHHSDFSKFSESALEFVPLLPAISPNLDLNRRAPSDWDLVFHLYSSLCYFSSTKYTAKTKQ
ncbi:hypothetical protein S7335_2787 [Synechococcus sp. PCC 7335]|uniref:tetratricopeptide repeat protein n=1 Tax=Synechococcus sp. (strain ATCC 29403 / PCC 7335) TaxID=91464 RepID=UPI00017EDC5D|nr:tetratricopeptide repeat protein [Synechococcus sp. PCC 7335]EDX85088.1 hypothetical protein S7335_2787 [Synechococcus sp. PCC 7335]